MKKTLFFFWGDTCGSGILRTDLQIRVAQVSSGETLIQYHFIWIKEQTLIHTKWERYFSNVCTDLCMYTDTFKETLFFMRHKQRQIRVTSEVFFFPSQDYFLIFLLKKKCFFHAYTNIWVDTHCHVCLECPQTKGLHTSEMKKILFICIRTFLYMHIFIYAHETKETLVFLRGKQQTDTCDSGVAMCCSVLQCVAVCCSVLRVLQCVTVCCHMLLCVAVCCSVLQRVTVCCYML